jgi:hypothetical protein
MTIDLIDIFYGPSIIDIDPTNAFLAIGAHLCPKVTSMDQKGTSVAQQVIPQAIIN